MIRMKRKRSPNGSPAVSPPTSPTLTKKFRLSPPGEGVSSRLVVTHLAAKKDGCPQGVEGVTEAVEGKSVQPEVKPDGLGISALEETSFKQDAGWSALPYHVKQERPDKPCSTQSFEKPSDVSVERPLEQDTNSSGQGKRVMVMVKVNG